MRCVFSFFLVAVIAACEENKAEHVVDKQSLADDVKSSNSTAAVTEEEEAVEAVDLDEDAIELQEAMDMPYSDVKSKMAKLLNEYIDADGDAHISADELTQWLEYLYEAVLSKHVREKMTQIDKDEDGLASFDEVIDSTSEDEDAQITEEEKKEVGYRFKACDADGDGKLNFSELLNAVAPRHFYEAAAVEAKAVAMACDKDEDEKLTLEEFSSAPQSFLSDVVGNHSGENVKAFFEEADVDSNGELSEDELTNNIMKVAEEQSGYVEAVENVVNDLLPMKPEYEEKRKAQEEAKAKKIAAHKEKEEKGEKEKEEKEKGEKKKGEKEKEDDDEDDSDDDFGDGDGRNMSIQDILENSTTLASWVMSEVTESGDVLTDFDSFELETAGGDENFGGDGNPFGGGEMSEDMIQQLLKMLGGMGGGGDGEEGDNPFAGFGGGDDDSDDDISDSDSGDSADKSNEAETAAKEETTKDEL
eukprot:Lankesteria_metandrocarpae@DN5110_c1_g1_i1.p1